MPTASCPETSVILPVRNGGAYLVGAVDSLLGQTYRDFELLLVDDHSTDGALGEVVRRHPGLRVLRSAGRGVEDAFRTGMLAARGAFLARMDADDLCLPQRLALQIAHFKQHPELGIVGGCVELFASGDVGEGNLHYQAWLNGLCEPEDIRDQIFVESPIPNPTAVFRRSVLDELGGYRTSDWPEDYDLFLRADRLGVRMGKPGPIVLRWREHGARATRTQERYSLSQFQRVKVHHLVQGRLAGRPVLLLGAGPTGSAVHDLLRAEGAKVQAFVDVHPRRIGGTKRGLPVLAYAELERGPTPMLLGCVGSRGGRAELRRLLTRIGKREGRDFLFMA